MSRVVVAVVLAAAGIVSAAPAMAQAGGLKNGEYTCIGVGGRILIGLGFKVSGGRYTDLDNKEAGTYTVSGSTVTFRGGHLDGQVGRDLKNSSFVLGAAASCGPG